MTNQIKSYQISVFLFEFQFFQIKYLKTKEDNAKNDEEEKRLK